MADVDTAPLPNKTRVRLAETVRGVPEGAAGTVRGVVGFALPRHRVEFDTGRFVTSVARTQLVPEDDWEQFLADREAAAERAAAAAEAPEATPAEPSGADTGAGDGAAPADDRLAALLAKSKAAREKKAAG